MPESSEDSSVEVGVIDLLNAVTKRMQCRNQCVNYSGCGARTCSEEYKGSHPCYCILTCFVAGPNKHAHFRFQQGHTVCHYACESVSQTIGIYSQSSSALNCSHFPSSQMSNLSSDLAALSIRGYPLSCPEYSLRNHHRHCPGDI